MTQKSVLITGCSEGGLGHALALAFAERGIRVFATARDVAKMGGPKGSLAATGATLLQLDTTDAGSVAAAAKQVLCIVPDGPDIIVNNAGAGLRGPLLDVPLDALRAHYEVNVFGHLAVLKAFLPAMIRRRSGTVINVGSAAGFWAWPFLGAYSSSKGALKHVSDVLRLELEPFGINVVHAAPGFVSTNIYDNTSAAGRIYVDRSGPYGPLAEKLTGSLLHGAMDAGVFARRFASMALSASPPALYLDGNRCGIIFFVGTCLPQKLHDLIVRSMSGISALASAAFGGPQKRE